MNSITISGLLVSDPQVRQAGQTQVCEAQLEVAGQKPEDAKHTVKVLAWGKKAEEFSKVKNGSFLLIDGTCGLESVDRPEGFKETSVEISVEKWIPLRADPLFNKVVLVGRTGQDVDVKYFESSSVTAKTTLAVDRGKKDSAPYWFNIQSWSKTAEVMGNHCRKGSLIGGSGVLLFEDWTDRNSGVNRSKPVVRVDQLRLLGSKKDNESNGNYQQEETQRQPVAATAGKAKSSAPVDNWDDVPF